jgi:hypothetical protein
MMNGPDPRPNGSTAFALQTSAYKLSHVVAALSSAVGSFGVLYLVNVGNIAVWLAVSVLIGFVFVRGTMAMREARGAVIRVSDDVLRIPPAATPARRERVIARNQIRSVRLTRSHVLTGRVLEIRDSAGERLRLWPTMVDTEGLAHSIERRMGIETTFRSTWGYLSLAALVIFLLLYLMVWLLLRHL